jgi:hypothetical protein
MSLQSPKKFNSSKWTKAKRTHRKMQTNTKKINFWRGENETPKVNTRLFLLNKMVKDASCNP